MLLPQRSSKETVLILGLSILKLFLKYHCKIQFCFAGATHVLTVSTSQSSPTLCCVFFFFFSFKIFFFMWTIFKVFIEFVHNIAYDIYVLGFFFFL